MKKQTFKPRARLLQLLGDQLIRDPRIGVFELVKNAYDADSADVDVIFLNVENPQYSSIVVRDRGEGMDLKTVIDVWLEPGADYREAQRQAGKRTPKFHRLPLGEKGVGRFASHKLGDRIEMITRRKGSKEIKVEIDWKKLTSEHKYLADAPIEVVEREPELFKAKDAHGTEITIKKLRNQWTKSEIRQLYRAIAAISAPLGRRDDFVVNFYLRPDPDWLKGILSAKDVEKQAMFFYQFAINGGQFDFRYEFRPLPALLKTIGNKYDLKPRILEEKNKTIEFFTMEITESGRRQKRPERANLTEFGVGPVAGRVIAFDRDRDILKLYVDASGITQYLDQVGGVRVYRDRIRVYNYGEPETDWLRLDERRIQRPARRLSNNLLLGEVHLDLAQSKALIEKTNREGFVENDAYREFRRAVLGAVIRFEQERAKDKDKIREAFEVIRAKKADFPVVRGPEEAIDALRVAIKKRGWEGELEDYVRKVEETYVEMRDTLINAVAPGVGLAIVFHEIERGIRDLHSAIDKGDSKQRIVVLARHMVELLDGASYLVRTTSKRSLKASDIVRHAIFSLSPRFAYHNIELANAFEKNASADFKITGSDRMLTASMVNLIDNSIYWLNVKYGNDKKSNLRKRVWIGPSTDFEGPAIVVADNGPGLEDDPEDVVRPFFTRKEEGMGLGLYFADLTMRSHNGRLVFPSLGECDVPSAYSGAIVAMVFSGQ